MAKIQALDTSSEFQTPISRTPTVGSFTYDKVWERRSEIRGYTRKHLRRSRSLVYLAGPVCTYRIESRDFHWGGGSLLETHGADTLLGSK